MDRKCSFVPFCKEHCRWKSRAALIIWHCRATVPCFSSLFVLSGCVGASGGIYRSRTSCECRPTGAERKVLEMVSSRHTGTRHSCRSLLEEGLVTASPGVLISFAMLGTCGRQVMRAYQVSFLCGAERDMMGGVWKCLERSHLGILRVYVVSLIPSDTSPLKPLREIPLMSDVIYQRRTTRAVCVCCVGYAGERQTDLTDRSACEGEGRRCDLSVSLGWILGWCVPSTSGRRWLYSVSLQVSRIEVARRVEMSDITCQVWRCGCTGCQGLVSVVCSLLKCALGAWSVLLIRIAVADDELCVLRYVIVIGLDVEEF